MAYFVFGDESGGLANPEDRFVVIAAIGTKQPRQIDRVTKKVHAWLLQRGKRDQSLNELRFYNARDETKLKLLTYLAQEKEIDVYLLILEKEKRILANSPENFAFLLWPLFELILTRDADTTFELDRHFSKASEREQVKQKLEELANTRLKLEQVDSQRNLRIQVADFVAGATLSKYQREEEEYLDLLRPRIVVERW